MGSLSCANIYVNPIISSGGKGPMRDATDVQSNVELEGVRLRIREVNRLWESERSGPILALPGISSGKHFTVFV